MPLEPEYGRGHGCGDAAFIEARNCTFARACRCFAPMLLAVLTLLAAGGCGPTRLPQVDRIYKLTLQTAQHALDVDGSGTPDGVPVQLVMYGVGPKGPRAVLGSGLTEISIYSGSAYDRQGRRCTPLHTWSFTSEEMRGFVARTYGLLCYRMNLLWPRELRIDGDAVTIQASYTASDNSTVYSIPAEILLH